MDSPSEEGTSIPGGVSVVERAETGAEMPIVITEGVTSAVAVVKRKKRKLVFVESSEEKSGEGNQTDTQTDDNPLLTAESGEGSSAEEPKRGELEKISIMTAVDIGFFRRAYKIPDTFQLRQAKGNETVLEHEEGWIPVFADLFEKSDFRLPMPKFFEDFLTAYRLQPCSIAPNAWKMLGAFMILCQQFGVEPSLKIFAHFYDLKKHSDGVYFLSALKNMRLFGTPSSTHPARERFFFCKMVEEWKFPSQWTEKYKIKFEKDFSEEQLKFVDNALAFARAGKGKVIDTSLYCTLGQLMKAKVFVLGDMSADKVVLNIIASRAAGRAALQVKKDAPAKKRKLNVGSSSAVPESTVPSTPPPSKDKQISTEEGAGTGDKETTVEEPTEQPVKALEAASQRQKGVLSVVDVSSLQDQDSNSTDEYRMPDSPPPRSLRSIPKSTDHYRVIAARHNQSIQDLGVLQEYAENMFTERDLGWAGGSVDAPARIMKRGLESMLLAKEVADRLKGCQERQKRTDIAYEAAGKQVESLKKAKVELLKEKEGWATDRQNLETKLEGLNQQHLRGINELKAAAGREIDLASKLHQCQVQLEEAKKSFNEQMAKAVEEASTAAVEEYKGTEHYEAELQKRSEPVVDAMLKMYREDLLSIYPNLDISALDRKFSMGDPIQEEPGSGGASNRDQTEELQPEHPGAIAEGNNVQLESADEQRQSETSTLPAEVLAIARAVEASDVEPSQTEQIEVEQTGETPAVQTE